MNDVKNAKLTIAAVAVAIFVLSGAFALILITDESIAEDTDRLFMYMAVFLAAFVILNILLVIVAVRASKRLKAKMDTKRCASCSSIIPRDAEACPKCRAVQPMVVPENSYLSPKKSDNEIRPKK